jgi:hypothetical protein
LDQLNKKEIAAFPMEDVVFLAKKVMERNCTTKNSYFAAVAPI